VRGERPEHEQRYEDECARGPSLHRSR
jgi:hypothetical protein